VAAGYDDMLTAILILTVAMLAMNVALAVSILGIRFRVRHADIRRRDVGRRWQPRIHDLLAGDADPDALRPLARRIERCDLLDLVARYARRVNGVELERLRTFARPLLPGLASRLRSRHPEERASALQTFGLLGGNPQVLVDALDDPSPLVAMVAASALSTSGEPGPAAAVVAHLDRFELWSPGYLSAMLADGGAVIAGGLRSALADEGASALSRSVAADALRLMRDPASAAIGARVLVGSPDRETAAACLRILEVMGTAADAPTARRYLDHPDFVLRARAAAALGALEAGDGDVAALDEAIDDASPWVALHAAQALSKAGRHDVLRAAAASLRPGAAAAREALAGAP
jgi:HEAT repeat protein